MRQACPQLAEADIRLRDGNSRSMTPTRTLVDHLTRPDVDPVCYAAKIAQSAPVAELVDAGLIV
jgi:hypothetical protein